MRIKQSSRLLANILVLLLLPQAMNAEASPSLSSIMRQQKTSQTHAQDVLAPSNYLYNVPSIETVTPSNDASLIAQETTPLLAITPPDPSKTVLINFNNVSIIEYIRFISRLSNRNFVFDENDLQFNVTIISEEPATIENIMTALLQELRIHDLSMFEEGNNLIIHKNPRVNGISNVSSDELQSPIDPNADIVTQVFRLNTLDPEKAASILRPLISDSALVEVLKDSNHLIVTDLTANVQKISQLLKSIDAPNSGVVIGQYVSRLTPIETLIPLAQQIMQPISQDQTLAFVPQTSTNSVFIISSPFLVERTIAILQYMDQDQAATRILNLHDLRFGGIQGVPITPKPEVVAPLPQQGSVLRTPTGQWTPGVQGNWIFKPELPSPSTALPQGNWVRDYEGNWDFNVGAPALPGSPAPNGRWILDKDGNWVFEVGEGETFSPIDINRQFQGRPLLPGGAQKITRFFIYKLKYRKGESVEPVLRQIADTLQQNERGNEDLIAALRSVQWLVGPNSLVLSGTPDSLDKINALIDEVDIPMRQVFIEMLILETTLTDSLNFGVTYGTRFGGGGLSGSQGFVSGATSTPLIQALATAGLSNLGAVVGQQNILIPDGTNLANQPGFNLGIIGRKITHCGEEFGSIGALINALHDRVKDKVVSNPKILIEDNAQAEIFVGLNTPYRTQSISNDRGNVITSNFEYRDIGTTLRVTPYIGNGDIVALDIQEEVSTIIAGLITNASTASTSPGPTTRINRTLTRVHIPDTYFLVISGLMQNEVSRERNQVPCLGAIPLLGAGFSAKFNRDEKRNLLIFIRPKIIDTEAEVQELTKRNQDIYDYKNTLEDSDIYETEEALDLFNIKKTLHPEEPLWDDESKFN